MSDRMALLAHISTALESNDMAKMKMRLCLMESELMGEVMAVPRPAAFLAWAREMFGPVALVRGERLLRFIEEAIELAHAEGMERTTFNTVADRVYSRPAGDTPKEIGQAQACLETLAESIGLSSDGEAEREWQRVQGIPKIEWERRHAAKQKIGIALAPLSTARPYTLEEMRDGKS